MNTLERFAPDSPLAQKQIPSTIAWYLADLGESRGKQDLFTRQSPQVLKALREHALIESAVSSNRIEGVEVEQARVGTIVFGTPLLKDREEESVSGYRDALEKIHSSPWSFQSPLQPSRSCIVFAAGKFGMPANLRTRTATSSRSRRTAASVFASRPFRQTKPLRLWSVSFRTGATAFANVGFTR